MIFGKIDYLNLLPFHVFMKHFTKSSQQKMSMNYHRGVPSEINKKFMARRIDAAFISSVNAKKYKNVRLGIIAKNAVKSVLVIPNANTQNDDESATSNVLANVLGIKGKVLIGDKALRYALESSKYIDLAEVWKRRYKKPFVFALLCYHKDQALYKQVEEQFLKQKVKIPQYILKQASQKTGVACKDILAYLELISYEYNISAQLGLKKFYHLIDN